MISIFICEGDNNPFLEIKKELKKMARHMEALTAAVRKNTDATASATAMIHGLAQQIRDAAGDPAAIEALANEIDAAADQLSEAVLANTPAAEDSGEDTAEEEDTGEDTA